jgi:hypothetical protein
MSSSFGSEEQRFGDETTNSSQLAATIFRGLVAALGKLREEGWDDQRLTAEQWGMAGQAVGLDLGQLQILTAVAAAAAAVAVSASRQRCPTKVDGEFADIEEYFPTSTTPHHYRCKHTPPHCWDANKQPIDPCPSL